MKIRLTPTLSLLLLLMLITGWDTGDIQKSVDEPETGFEVTDILESRDLKECKRVRACALFGPKGTLTDLGRALPLIHENWLHRLL